MFMMLVVIVGIIYYATVFGGEWSQNSKIKANKNSIEEWEEKYVDRVLCKEIEEDLKNNPEKYSDELEEIYKDLPYYTMYMQWEYGFKMPHYDVALLVANRGYVPYDILGVYPPGVRIRLPMAYDGRGPDIFRAEFLIQKEVLLWIGKTLRDKGVPKARWICVGEFCGSVKNGVQPCRACDADLVEYDRPLWFKADLSYQLEPYARYGEYVKHFEDIGR